MSATESEISDFLFKFKYFATTPGGFYLAGRNLQALADLQLTVDQALNDVILGLTYEDYSRGPEDDHDRLGKEVWIFGYIYDGRELYIKLSADLSKVAKCISFHEARHEITYPHKNGGE